MIGIRICKVCGVELTNDNCYKIYFSGKICDRKNICKKCHIEKTIQAKRELKKKVIIKFGSKCVYCGETDLRCLQLDHINGGGCKERSSLDVHSIYRKALINPEQYQILCANCNWKKRWDNNEHN